ncbi:MAG: hypothetical protein MUQ27_12010, partial [Acidimicrobiia bacterium]|nr:hypothetical protein [Acidimicrobiia bacterium]
GVRRQDRTARFKRRGDRGVAGSVALPEGRKYEWDAGLPSGYVTRCQLSLSSEAGGRWYRRLSTPCRTRVRPPPIYPVGVVRA